MKLEETLQKYLDHTKTLEYYHSSEMSFYRRLTDEELDYMDKFIKHQGFKFVCFKCLTCEELSNGKEPYHIDRV